MCGYAIALLVSESVMVVPSKAGEAPVKRIDVWANQSIAEKRLFVVHGPSAFWRNDDRSISLRTASCGVDGAGGWQESEP